MARELKGQSMRHLKFVNSREIYTLIPCDDCEYARQVRKLLAAGFVYWKRHTYVDATVFERVNKRGWRPADVFYYIPGNVELAQQQRANILTLPTWRIARAAL